MKLSDLVARYTIPPEDYEVELPGLPPTKVAFRRIRNASELADLKEQAAAWAENARVHATGDARQALGELVGDSGKSCIIRAYIMAEAVKDDEADMESKRYKFCQLAAYAGPVFELLWNGVVASCVSDAILQVGDAVEGKAGCGQTPPCASDCECAETPGESTPTN